MDTPFTCDAKVGYFSNARARLVSAPVATSHADLGGVERSAVAMASIAEPGCARMSGDGRRSVPSRPDSPWIAGA